MPKIPRTPLRFGGAFLFQLARRRLIIRRKRLNLLNKGLITKDCHQALSRESA